MRIALPTPCLVVLVAPSGAGKSTFASRHFANTEIVSSDRCRALVADSEADQSATQDAFDLVHLIARKRLERRKLAVIDATSLRAESRAALVEIARRANLPAVAIALALDESELVRRAAARPDRRVPEGTVRKHAAQFQEALPLLSGEGFSAVHVVDASELDNVRMVREPLSCMRPHERGPFDIIGDVHGCIEELRLLLERLGYTGLPDNAVPPAGRKAVFVGDLVDRGPDSPGVLRLVLAMTEAGHAFCVPGNHDAKLARWIRGRSVHVAHGLEHTIDQLRSAEPAFLDRVAGFFEGLPSHLILDRGRLAVAHAGMRANLQARESKRVRSFALYGQTTGELDEHGRPVRLDWARDYRGRRSVVYGHTPVHEPGWRNNTLNIDTGCAYGGALTALRYPEMELVSVPAARIYYHKPGFSETRGAGLSRPDRQP